MRAWAPQLGLSSLFLTPFTGAPFSLVENSTYESVSSSAQPLSMCLYSIHWCNHSHWLKTQPMRVWASLTVPRSCVHTPSTGAAILIGWNSTYESVSSSASPQFLISYSIHWCAILIGWKLNLWEREFLSQSPVPVSVFYLVAAIYRHLKAELEFLKSLWGLGTEKEEGYRYRLIVPARQAT